MRAMKHYKDIDDNVFGYDDDYPAPEGLTEITVEEARAIHDARSNTPEALRMARIAQLKQLLAETDYVALADYDKDKPEVLAQRAAWRAEIRELEP